MIWKITSKLFRAVNRQHRNRDANVKTALRNVHCQRRAASTKQVAAMNGYCLTHTIGWRKSLYCVCFFKVIVLKVVYCCWWNCVRRRAVVSGGGGGESNLYEPQVSPGFSYARKDVQINIFLTSLKPSCFLWAQDDCRRRRRANYIMLVGILS